MDWWYWPIIALVGVAAMCHAIKLQKAIESSPLPFKWEYVTAYPDRVVDGIIHCGCGSSELTCRVAPVNVGPVFNVCKSCNTTLYATNISDKKPHQAEAV